MEAVLDSAVKMEVDLVLIQEPRGGKEKDSTRSHPGFNFIRGREGEPNKCWITVNWSSRCRVTELRNLTQEYCNHTQGVEVTLPNGELIVVANLYDRHTMMETDRPAQKAAWGEIAKQKRVIIAGDMNTYSKMWNPKAEYRRKAGFWENLIEEEELLVWNNEEATRSGPGAHNHSIIDLTLSSPNIELNWSILGNQATGSDHELIAWEVLAKEGEITGGGGTSTEVTGWDIRGWDPTGKEGKDREAVEEKRVKAQQFYRNAIQPR